VRNTWDEPVAGSQTLLEDSENSNDNTGRRTSKGRVHWDLHPTLKRMKGTAIKMPEKSRSKENKEKKGGTTADG